MLLLATCRFNAQAQNAAPAAEQQAKAWLATIDSGDRASFLEFLQKNRPPAVERIDNTLQFRAQTGGFELIKPEESTPTHFAALVKEKDCDQFARMQLEVEPNAPHRIIKLHLQHRGRQNLRYPV